MKRFVLLLSILWVFGFGLFAAAYAQDVATDVGVDVEEIETLPLAILEVKLKSLEVTDYYPDCGEDCLPWSLWHRYKAKVSRVIYGDYEKSNIEFVVLQSVGFYPVKNATAFVEIAEFENSETIKNLGTQYYAVSVERPREIVCFRTPLIEALKDSDAWWDDEIPWIDNADDGYVPADEYSNDTCFDTHNLREKD